MASHVEKWAKANSHTFAAGRAIDAQAVFQSKPNPDALFNANPDGGGGGGMLVTRYEAHAGPVLALEASPFHRHLFLSAGADGMLKFSSLLQHRPLLCLDPAGIVGVGSFLHKRERERERERELHGREKLARNFFLSWMAISNLFTPIDGMRCFLDSAMDGDGWMHKD